jgi:signal peptide peptidase SppA
MKTQDIFAAGFELPGIDVAEYFGAWAIEPRAFTAAVDRFQGVNLHMHLDSDAAKQAIASQRDRGAAVEVTNDGIAVVSAVGPLMKSVSSMSGGTSTVYLRRQVRAARQDASIVGALLKIDSPGGTWRGLADLANEVAALAAEKPTFSYIEDQATSAAFGLASQANKRFANNPSALAGSLGTYTTIVDESGRAEKMGVRVIVVKAGEHKGSLSAGTKVTDAQLAEVQRLVNAMNDEFLSLIARGQGKPLATIRELADGRVILAGDAVKLGLVDGIQSLDQTYSQLVAATKAPHRPAAPRSEASAAEIGEPMATSITTESSAEAYLTTVNALISTGMSKKDAHAKVARECPGLHADYLAATNPNSVARPTAAAAEDRQSVFTEYNAAVEAAMAKGMDRRRAIATVARNNPALQQRFERIYCRVPVGR